MIRNSDVKHPILYNSRMSQLTALGGLYWEYNTLDSLILCMTRLKDLHLWLSKERPFTQLQQLNILSNLEELRLCDATPSKMDFGGLHLPNLTTINIDVTTERDLTSLMHLTRLTRLENISINLSRDQHVGNRPFRPDSFPNLKLFELMYEGFNTFQQVSWNCCVPAAYDMSLMNHFPYNARHHENLIVW